MQLVFERCHDAQIRSRAPYTPEQGGARNDQTAIDRHHVDRQQIVASEPELACQPAVAATKRQTGYPGISVDPERGRKTEGLRFMVELAEAQSRLRPRGPPGWVDTDAFHRQQIDHQTAGADGLAGIVMPTTADRYEKAVFARKANTADDIGRAGTARDQRRALVDHAVPDLAGGIVALIFGAQQFAAKVGCELVDYRVIDNPFSSIRGGDT
jgi:hypothetical protein